MTIRIPSSLIEKSLNKVVTTYQVGERAKDVHGRLLVADLHADPLLWNRDLLKRSNYGHVDLPRLVDGNVALQVFAAVTKVPWGLNFERNTSSSDMLTLLLVAQGWPRCTYCPQSQFEEEKRNDKDSLHRGRQRPMDARPRQ